MLEEAASTILVAPAGGPADAGWQTPAALVERLCAGRRPSRPFRRRCGTRTSRCGRGRRNDEAFVVVMLRCPVSSFGRGGGVESRIVVQTSCEAVSAGRAGVDARRPSDDARAAVKFLQQHPDIDPKRIGVVGHSQGGTVAQILGHLYGDSLAFIASLAAPTYDTQRRITHEYYNGFLCSSEPEEVARDKSEKKAISDLNWVNAFPLIKTWRHLSELSEFSPAPHLAQLRLPSYFAFAELDYYVSAEWGVSALKKAAGNSANTTIQVFPGLDHDFRQTADICAGAELDLDDRRQNDASKNRALEEAKSTDSLESDEFRQKKPNYSKDFQRNFQQWVLAEFRLNIL